MFKYIMDLHLNTKAGQAANADLSVDFRLARIRTRRLPTGVIDGNVAQLTYGGAGHIMGTYRMIMRALPRIPTFTWSEAARITIDLQEVFEADQLCGSPMA